MLVRYIVITRSGRVYEYRTNDKMVVRDKKNLGIDHSVKDIGFKSKAALKKEYPEIPIYWESDKKVPSWLRFELKQRVEMAKLLKSGK